MIALSIKTEDTTKRVADAAERASFRNVGQAAGAIFRTARAKIETDDQPSAPGEPPHTRQRLLPRAIRFDHDRKAQSAVVGPRASVVGEAGAAHELGEVFQGQDFDERPYMGPALEENQDRFASSFESSIGE